ncbi:MAG TPA: AGE family epimerase/isomerase [Polyangiaceae bacterium]|nr:AGE family epimerase/isomerase [Polyangiaceae bacterium]
MKASLGPWRWVLVAASAASAACLPTPPLPPEPPRPLERAPTAPVLYSTRTSSGTSVSESALEDRLGSLAARLEGLAAGVMDFWKAHGPDPVHGGFYGKHDRRGDPVADEDKGLIQQARHLWSFSTWYARREQSAEIKAVADNTYGFIRDHFLDAKDGEYVYRVSRDGKKVVDSKKLLYAEGFAIFALSTYADVFDVAEAGERALACFHSIDRRAHDAEHLGYDQSSEPGWLTPGAQKDTNTHIHLLEAFTALYRQSHDATVRARLDELVKVVATRIVQPANYAHKEFLADWHVHDKPVVSYGHDLETTWLLIDALDALGTPLEPQRTQVALVLGKHSADLGFDSDKGGYFEEGVPGGAPTKLEKIWWIQAEALPGLWWLYRLGNDSKYLDRLERTLGWIETYQVDHEYGEWFWGINPDGSVGSRGDHKGEEWKAEYHALRATLFTADWIKDALSKPPANAAPTAAEARRRGPQGLDSIARR